MIREAKRGIYSRPRLLVRHRRGCKICTGSYPRKLSLCLSNGSLLHREDHTLSGSFESLAVLRISSVELACTRVACSSSSISVFSVPLEVVGDTPTAWRPGKIGEGAREKELGQWLWVLQDRV